MRLLTEGETYTSLYDNGVPRKGVLFKDAKKAVKTKANAIRPQAQELEKADPDVETQAKNDLRNELIDVMEKQFYDDKWLLHEYTVLAVIPPAEGASGRLLFLDTQGNERQGEANLTGATQPRWSDLKALARRDSVCWGYADVAPERIAELPSPTSDEAAAGDLTDTGDGNGPAQLPQAGPTDQPEDPAAALSVPFDRVVMHIRGLDEVYSFDLTLPDGSPAPAVVYAYALEKLSPPGELKVWLEFHGETAGKDTQLKELWLTDEGRAIWRRPLWMTKKWFGGAAFDKELKARNQFLGIKPPASRKSRKGK